MRPSDFDYVLPPELIAQYPLKQRDASRLLELDRASRKRAHGMFPDLLNHISPGDLLVFNDSKVFPARLRGTRPPMGGEVEFLLLEETQKNEWWCMARPGKRLRIGAVIDIRASSGLVFSGWQGTILNKNEEGHCLVAFAHGEERHRSLVESLDSVGEIPLPPYIKRPQPDQTDANRYQTIFATHAGSVAAPTAGLHFSPSCLEALREKGAALHFVTLHVGLGTFAPVKTEEFSEHVMHEERYHLPPDTAEAIAATRLRGGRVIAVGTTSLRVLESAALSWNNNSPQPSSGRTRLFVYPPFHFRVADALLTNFHLPKSTLLALVSAFAAPGQTSGRDLVLSAYQEAINEGYRFFSYGDAMFIH